MQIQNFLGISAFIIAALGILFGSHYFIYYSMADFFKISDARVKAWMAFAFFLLAIGYIVSSIIAHRSENVFTRSLYFSSSLWLGILTNLTIFFAIAWAVVGLSKLAGLQANSRYLGIVFMSLAFIFSAYGVWNAYHPRIKDVTVRIKGLPQAWQGKTVVQISDVHLGHVFKEDFLRKIVSEVNSVKPEMVFITGDLFDGMDGNLDLRVQPLNDIRAGKGVFFVTGNHETYFGVDRVYGILKNVEVEVLDDRLAEVDGLQIVGISYPDRGSSKDMVQAIQGTGFDRAKPSILLFHSPSAVGAAKRAGISLQLSGHTHKGQMFPFGLVTKLVFKGADYGLVEADDFSLYTSNGVGAWGPTMRTGNTPEIVAIRLEAK